MELVSGEVLFAGAVQVVHIICHKHSSKITHCTNSCHLNLHYTVVWHEKAKCMGIFNELLLPALSIQFRFMVKGKWHLSLSLDGWKLLQYHGVSQHKCYKSKLKKLLMLLYFLHPGWEPCNLFQGKMALVEKNVCAVRQPGENDTLNSDCFCKQIFHKTTATRISNKVSLGTIWLLCAAASNEVTLSLLLMYISFPFEYSRHSGNRSEMHGAHFLDTGGLDPPSASGTCCTDLTVYLHYQGPVSIYLRMVISMLKIRRPLGRLIFNMGIAIPGKTVFLIETAPESSRRATILAGVMGSNWRGAAHVEDCLFKAGARCRKFR